MGENYGTKGLLVLIVPRAQINLDYFKIISKNLNETLKFTFGNILPDLINRPDIYDLKEKLNDQTEASSSIKNQLDAFFNLFHKRLISSALFEKYDNNTDELEKISVSNRQRIYMEMRTKFLNAMSNMDLPFSIRTDLDTALSQLESQEFVDLENNYYRYRRQYLVTGTCMFYKVR